MKKPRLEDCPKCDKEVEVNPPFGKVVCPLCGLEGRWEVDYNGEDSWIYVEWND